MSVDSTFVKIAFRDANGKIETLWAIDLGDGEYQLDSSPWFQYGVSWKDVVEAEPDADGLLHYQRVRRKSGHKTLRVISENPIEQSFLDALVATGCTYEGATPRFLAIDVPADVELNAVVDMLDKSGLQWEYGDPTYQDIHGPTA